VAEEDRASVRRLAPSAGQAHGRRGFSRSTRYDYLAEIAKQQYQVRTQQHRLQHVLRRRAGDEPQGSRQQVTAMLQVPPPVFAPRWQKRHPMAGHSVQRQVRSVPQQRGRSADPAPREKERQSTDQSEDHQAQQRVKRPPVAPRAVQQVTQRVQRAEGSKSQGADFGARRIQVRQQCGQGGDHSQRPDVLTVDGQTAVG